MRVAIIGGKLQGVEATYLAKKAGWEVVLFDRRPLAQASRLADRFYCMDILTCSQEFIACLRGIDLILPAIEDIEVLRALQGISEMTSIPLAFDRAAYSISSSKRISNRLFHDIDVPSPLPWPDCDFPILLKPSSRSGSEGVQVIYTKQELETIQTNNPDEEWIIEEYLEGPSYSIEVVGFAGEYRVFQISELEMDEQYDCKRVLAPAELKYSLIKEFEELALKIAREITLNGIMDVETILHNGRLKVLEIDARLPSQTPTAVYHSSGINMVECLGNTCVQGSLYSSLPKQAVQNDQYVIYEHFLVTSEKIEASGEHILSQVGPLSLLTDFLGTDEVLTDYTPEKKEWVLTLITRSSDFKDAWKKREKVLQRIQEELKIPIVIDPYPSSLNKELNCYDSFRGKRYRFDSTTNGRVQRRVSEKDRSYTFRNRCACYWHALYRRS
ncbi:3-methylornithine--L-lysine ligase PylC [Desulfosporosinus nitroreducens]|uniref:3-methylornithine--L-lysine ligase PylC n=1 Tax=Desulfosporosinus nitroreducens TaxID=2018668 RepID=UPI00207CA55B|nr:3-methylornithine--L-lysine ligase PylC [Desulfosporosinus nitroreducens]MCO1604362.1 3-methylornithine--L-lysine ligase PylC [Desulfosporosinus nitroreducens]